jgi:cytochrome c oxidase subunit 2
MNVVPGLPTEFTFTPIKSTEEMRTIKGDPEFDYYLICNKICGNAHFNMKMKVVVEDEASYNKWINQQTGLFAKEKNNEGEDDENSTPENETLAIN